jgi:hypothetical protein
MMTARFSTMFRLLAFLAVTLYGVPSFAYGLTFCAKWPYSFRDHGQGEDGLLHSTPTASSGLIKAAYTFARLKHNGVYVAAGLLNSSGCFPIREAALGTYDMEFESYLSKPTGGVPTGGVVSVTELEGGVTEFFYNKVVISQLLPRDDTQTVNIAVDVPTVGNTMAAATQMLLESDSAIGPSLLINVVANDPGATGTSPTAPYTVSLGRSSDGSKDASWKYVIAHEIGHAIQFKLFGVLNHESYLEDPNINYCNCRHIENVLDAQHCLQGREQAAGAQQEGWGQFVALDAMNNDGQTDGTFIYYKDFLFPPTGYEQVGEKPPPIKIDGRKKYKWMNTLCPQVGAYLGTELDWMGFYFAVHSTTANKYTITQLQSTYLQGCTGGTCTGQKPTWTNLRDATAALYGAGSAKSNHWISRGADYKVDQTSN